MSSPSSFVNIAALDVRLGRQETFRQIRNYLNHCRITPEVAEAHELSEEMNSLASAPGAIYPPAWRTPERPARGPGESLCAPGAPQRPPRAGRAANPEGPARPPPRSLFNSPWQGASPPASPPLADLPPLDAYEDAASLGPASPRHDDGCGDNGLVPDSELLSSYADPERSPAWVAELVRRLTQPTCPVDLYHESYNELKRLVPDHPFFCPRQVESVRESMRQVHRENSLIPLGNPLHEALYGQDSPVRKS